MHSAVAVIDVGKTRAKLSLWQGGQLIHQRDRSNGTVVRDGVAQLDVEGVRAWLIASLGEAAALARIGEIVPVGHGAAAVLLDGASPVAALDYEAQPPRQIEIEYRAERDPFEATLTPRLPAGLNLGAQLFWLERLFPDLWPRSGRALLWPQYWAFVLCGEIASEVTSLGCHSDLWRPLERRFSDLAVRRGWSERLGPLRHASAVLGAVRPEVARATGLPSDCQVRCGVHDSNAALLAARASPELVGGPFSVVSTGTWVICLSAGAGAGDRISFDPDGDMLANVDVDGRPTPTARFMGGRDYEAWMGRALGAASDSSLLSAVQDTISPEGLAPAQLATWAALRLARKADRALALINAQGPVLIEGRFSNDPAFCGALARLRPGQPVFRSPLADGVAVGAARLADALPATSPLIRVAWR